MDREKFKSLLSNHCSLLSALCSTLTLLNPPSDDSKDGCSPTTKQGSSVSEHEDTWLEIVLHEMVARDTECHVDSPPMNIVDSELLGHEEQGQPSTSAAPQPSMLFQTEKEEHLTKELEEQKLRILHLEGQLRNQNIELQDLQNQIHQRDEIIASLRNG